MGRSAKNEPDLHGAPGRGGLADRRAREPGQCAALACLFWNWELAQRTGGKAYELTSVNNLLADLQAEPVVERLTRNQPLWSTPLWFIALIGLMLTEWLCRKWLRLS